MNTIKRRYANVRCSIEGTASDGTLVRLEGKFYAVARQLLRIDPTVTKSKRPLLAVTNAIYDRCIQVDVNPATPYKNRWIIKKL